jgi:hypothetical protein
LGVIHRHEAPLAGLWLCARLAENGGAGGCDRRGREAIQSVPDRGCRCRFGCVYRGRAVQRGAARALPRPDMRDCCGSPSSSEILWCAAVQRAAAPTQWKSPSPTIAIGKPPCARCAGAPHGCGHVIADTEATASAVVGIVLVVIRKASLPCDEIVAGRWIEQVPAESRNCSEK